MTTKVGGALLKASTHGMKSSGFPARAAAPQLAEQTANLLARQGNRSQFKVRFDCDSRGIGASPDENEDGGLLQNPMPELKWQDGELVRRERLKRFFFRPKPEPKPESKAPEDLHPPLHLYRAMLREAGYLPDPVARRYFHDHIVKRFRVHASYGTAWARPGSEESERARKIGKSRLKKHLREARKGLKLLMSASHGSQSHLRKALEIAYGRRGVRKHELLKDLMPERAIPENDTALQELAHAIESERAAPTSKKPELSEKLLALVKSQRSQQDRMFTKPNIKATKPVIPETNSWGRPFPKCREKNLTKSWYRETLERVMPPLPKHDWQKLMDLAVGRAGWDGPPKRRAQEPADGLEVKNQQEWHQITSRYMRRMWQAVFQQCPLIEWDSGRSRWLVTWGVVKDWSGLSLQPGTKIAEGAFREGGLPDICTVQIDQSKTI